MRLSKTVTVTAAEKSLVSMSPPRLSFVVQNISDSEIISIYAKKGKHLQGIYLYPHTWLQIFRYDDAAGQWYAYSISGGSTDLHVTEFFAERRLAGRPGISAPVGNNAGNNDEGGPGAGPGGRPL